MSDVLLKFDGSWADEIDLQGFIVMTDKEWKDYKKEVSRLHSSSDFSVNIGTNEDVTFIDADDYFDSFEVTKLQTDESVVLRKLFKSSITYENARNRVKLDVALCGVIPLFLPNNDESDEEEENEEDDEY